MKLRCYEVVERKDLSRYTLALDVMQNSWEKDLLGINRGMSQSHQFRIYD
jgi:hypothetical protein